MKARYFAWLLGAALLLASAKASAQIEINEIRTDHTGTDTDEYLELVGPSHASLAGYWYIVIGDASTDPRCGSIESVTDLSTWSIQADGFLCLRNSTVTPTLSGYDGSVPLIFENSDNVTHMLVTGFTGTLGMDVDTNDDGTMDVTPWTSIVDCVGIDKGTTPTCTGSTSEEFIYCATRVGPDGTFAPGHVYRYRDTQAWAIGAYDLLGNTDTPGAANLSSGLLPPEFVDVSRNRCVPTTGQTATVTAAVVQDPTIAELRYTVNGGSETALAMSMIGVIDDTTYFQTTIPAQGANATRVEYYVNAWNALPTPTRSFDEGYFVGWVSIGSLRAVDVNGSSLYRFYGARIRGNVTSPFGAFGSTDTDYYLQDATSGINVFQFGLHAVHPVLGDDITVEGTIDQYNGKLEISPSQDCGTLLVTINGSGTPPAPSFILPCDLNEGVEGRLVRIYGVTAITGGQTSFSGDTSYSVWNDYASGGCTPDTVAMRIDADTDIDGTTIPASRLDVTGIAGQFKSSPPYNSSYQLQPRAATDIRGIPATSVPDRAGTEAWITCSPNPFVDATTFRYSLPWARTRERTRVRLEVFDLNGRRVAELVNGFETPGDHRAILERSRLGAGPAGVYFYRLEAGKTRLTGRLVMMN